MSAAITTNENTGELKVGSWTEYFSNTVNSLKADTFLGRSRIIYCDNTLSRAHFHNSFGWRFYPGKNYIIRINIIIITIININININIIVLINFISRIVIACAPDHTRFVYGLCNKLQKAVPSRGQFLCNL